MLALGVLLFTVGSSSIDRSKNFHVYMSTFTREEILTSKKSAQPEVDEVDIGDQPDTPPAPQDTDLFQISENFKATQTKNGYGLKFNRRNVSVSSQNVANAVIMQLAGKIVSDDAPQGYDTENMKIGTLTDAENLEVNEVVRKFMQSKRRQRPKEGDRDRIPIAEGLFLFDPMRRKVPAQPKPKAKREVVAEPVANEPVVQPEPPAPAPVAPTRQQKIPAAQHVRQQEEPITLAPNPATYSAPPSDTVRRVMRMYGLESVDAFDSLFSKASY